MSEEFGSKLLTSYVMQGPETNFASIIEDLQYNVFNQF